MQPERNHVLTTADAFFSKAALWLLIIAGILLGILFFKLSKTSMDVQRTSAYTRVSNCIVAKVADPPTTQQDVEQCYTQVEKSTGIELERFDTQTHNEN